MLSLTQPTCIFGFPPVTCPHLCLPLTSLNEHQQYTLYTCPSAALRPSQNLSILVRSVLVHTMYKYTAIYYSFHIDIKVGFWVVFFFCDINSSEVKSVVLVATSYILENVTSSGVSGS